MNEPNPVVAEAPVETPITTEQPAVETAPVETAPVETVPVPEPQPTIPEIDFSDLAPPQPAYQYQQPVQNQGLDPDIIAALADEIANRIGIPAQERTIEEQKSVKDIEAEVEQRILQKLNQQSEAQQVIQQNVQASSQVENKYVERLTDTLKKVGIDYAGDPALLHASNMLYDQLKINAAMQLKRSQLVFTPQETAQLVQDHFKTFSEIYLKGRIGKPSPVTTDSLSPSSSAIPETKTEIKGPNEFTQFMDKKKAGKETLGDALSLLQKMNKRA